MYQILNRHMTYTVSSHTIKQCLNMVFNLVMMGVEGSQVTLSEEKAKFFIFSPSLSNLKDVSYASP